MATSRTRLAPSLHWRKRVLDAGRSQGVTHCPICAVGLDYRVTRKPNSAEPDHIIPAANGGTNPLSNGRVICRRCNQSRGNKTMDPQPPKLPQKVITTPIW
ncbi:HNH endonuclease [Leifsonia xyli]|uniref:HNH endonuclease n=1 Tax=Leifsonia xyli TaxID=1575 RepID=UPI0005A12ACA